MMRLARRYSVEACLGVRRAFEAALAIMAACCNTTYEFDDTVVAPCVSATECPDGLQCELEGRRCVECTADEHCAAGSVPHCDTASGRCVECLADSDCAPDSACRSARCVSPCMQRTAESCESSLEDTHDERDEQCEVSNGQCVHCDAARPCRGAETGMLCDAARGLCVQCITEADCSGARPRCDLIRGACVSCLTSADCPSPTPWCQTRTGICIARTSTGS